MDQLLDSDDEGAKGQPEAPLSPAERVAAANALWKTTTKKDAGPPALPPVPGRPCVSQERSFL